MKGTIEEYNLATRLNRVWCLKGTVGAFRLALSSLSLSLSLDLGPLSLSLSLDLGSFPMYKTYFYTFIYLLLNLVCSSLVHRAEIHQV